MRYTVFMRNRPPLWYDTVEERGNALRDNEPNGCATGDKKG
jgi:hypothetical protein